MAQRNGWFGQFVNDAFGGRVTNGGNRSAPSAPARQASPPQRPNTRIRTEADAQADARANRAIEQEAAVRRTQAARPSRPLTATEIAQIRARYD